jgi:hypothetical protein
MNEPFLMVGYIVNVYLFIIIYTNVPALLNPCKNLYCQIKFGYTVVPPLIRPSH